MGIPIIDSLFLATDLPLDSRSVVSVPNDVSRYWHAGFIGFETSGNLPFYIDNSLGVQYFGAGGVSQTYVDGSLAARDISISFLDNYNGIQDSSILFLDSSINQLFSEKADISYVDQTFLKESSLGTDFIWNGGLLDVSIDTISKSYVDGSLALRDTSININSASIIQLDASIVNINNYQNIQDASILNLEASLGNYVLKSGDIMTGSLVISGGGLQVSGDTSLGNLHASGDGTILGDLGIRGNLTIDGSVTFINTTQIDVSNNFINLNVGLVGIPPAILQSGIAVKRGDLEPYVFLFDEDTLGFRIGISSETSTGYLDSSTQAVATRQDNPIANGIAYWNGIENRFDTSAGLTYEPGIWVTTDVSLLLTSYLPNIGEALVVGTGGIIETAPIPDVSNFTTFNYVDGSLAERDASININSNNIIQLDASIVALENNKVNRSGDTMTGDLLIETDLSVNGKGSFTEFNVSGTVFPSVPSSGDKFYRTDLETDFQYDSSRGKWLSVNRNTFSAGDNRSNAGNTNYLSIGTAVMDSITGIHIWKPGVITMISVQNNRIVAGAGRSLELRVNNSTTYKETITIATGNTGAYKKINLDVSAGDVIQLLTIPGSDRIDDIIFNFEVAERA